MGDLAAEWTTTHPTEPGLVWVSVEPKGRDPAPWKELAPVFPIVIDFKGNVWEEGKDEPTYNVKALPVTVTRGVKFLDASCDMPDDPWKEEP